MYEPRKPRTRRPLKMRSAFFISKPLSISAFWQKNGWLSLVTLGTAVVPPRVVPRIFTYIKKLLRYPKTHSRFWVNAQCAFLVTRKPLNVRMGKGKGAKVRFYTKINHNVPLAAISSLREGFKKRLKRFVSIRLGRRVLIAGSPLSSSKIEWAQRHRTQTNFLKERAAELKVLLTFVRRPSLKFFFGKLFRRSWRKPRLRWRLKWPSLPKVSSKLKARRRKWGSGLKNSAPVWAGLSSLMLGVRKTKTPSKENRDLIKHFKSQASHAFSRRRFFLRTWAVPAIKKTIGWFENKFLYRLLRLGALKKKKVFCPQSLASLPFNSTARNLRSKLSRFGFNLSQREVSVFASLKGGSLTNTVKVVTLLEKTSLVVYGTTCIAPNEGEPTIEGPLAFQHDNGSPGDESEPLPIDMATLVLNYSIEDGFLDPWPRVRLGPLLLTQVSLTPLLPLYS